MATCQNLDAPAHSHYYTVDATHGQPVSELKYSGWFPELQAFPKVGGKLLFVFFAITADDVPRPQGKATAISYGPNGPINAIVARCEDVSTGPSLLTPPGYPGKYCALFCATLFSLHPSTDSIACPT